MNLVETTPVASGTLPLTPFRDHLRLGTGFADDDVQDPLLERCLRAALARVEGLCAKAVLSRDFVLGVGAWRDLSRQVLPLAPVAAVSRLAIYDRGGVETVVDPGLYRLIGDAHAPLLISAGYSLPRIPLAGRAEIGFSAGFGGWGDVPGDLAQAVLMLAAHTYEGRDGEGDLPGAVAGILARYRPVHIGGRA